MLQAKSIRNEIYANLDGEELNNKLDNLLTFYRIVDNNKNVLYTLEELRSHWYKYIQPKFDVTNNTNVAKWLTNKFNLLKLKIKNQPTNKKT